MRATIFFLVFSLCLVIFAKDYGDATAIFISNYDGDTITVDIKGYPPIVGDHVSVRVKGIDTPEIKGKDKYLAKKAKELVRSMLQKAQIIELRNIERDKYFRILADVYADGQSVSELLIFRNLAVPYDGGTKNNRLE